MSDLTLTGKEFKNTFRAVPATVFLGSYCRYALRQMLSWAHMVVREILGPDPPSELVGLGWMNDFLEGLWDCHCPY